MEAPEWVRLAQDGNGLNGGFWTNAAATDDSPKYIREDIVERERKGLEMEYALLYQSSNRDRIELGMHERGHENSVRMVARLLHLCDENGLGDKAREVMEA